MEPEGVLIPEMTRSSSGMEPVPRPPSRAAWWVGLAAVLVVSAGYMLYFIDRGWIPHDEGTLAHSAERVLAGELPHRDFVEGYTGGLSYLHAFAFKVFGIHLMAIRYALFIVAVVWVAVLYQATARMLSPIAAGAVTLLAVFWSVPNYPAAMPSWYNLFLATGVLAALLAYIDSSNRWWLLAAGVVGGLSVLIKTHGLLAVAAGLLFILYYESEAGTQARDARRSGVVFRLAVGAILLTALMALLAIGFSRGTWLDLYQFTLPGCAIVAIVGRKVFRAGGPSHTAARLMVRAAIPYALGVAIPIAAFAGHYAMAGALPDLVRGVVFLPARLLVGASLEPPLPLGLIPLAVAVFVAIDFKGRSSRIAILQDGLGLAVIALMLVPKTGLALEPFVSTSLAGATPVVIPLLAILIARHEGNGGDWKVRSQYVLAGCVAAFCSLVQYPFAAPLYFSYSLPLLLLAVVALVRETTFVRMKAIQGLTCVYLLFGALYITPMNLEGLLGPVAKDDTAILDLPRAGLRIARADAEHYAAAVRLLQTHASSGVIYAGPDAPDLYFLSAMKNPTPAIFDYLVPDTLFHQRLVQRLDSLDIDVVAIRKRVFHSPPLAPEIQAAFASKYPLAREVGRFTIRWR
jgi:hypothetical protein